MLFILLVEEENFDKVVGVFSTLGQAENYARQLKLTSRIETVTAINTIAAPQYLKK